MGRAHTQPADPPEPASTKPGPVAFTFIATASAAKLAARVGGRAGRPFEVERTWLDTFDWRLWNQGLALEVDRGPALNSATLRSTGDHRVHWVQRDGEVPVCAEDLPPGPWRRSLAGVLGIRALVPVGSEQVQKTEIVCADGEGKTVATLMWERVGSRPDQGQGRERPAPRPVARVRLIPARGYDRTARELAALLVEHAGLVPETAHPLEQAATHGLRPGQDPGKLRLVLAPGMRADDALRHMLSTLFAVMGANEPWLASAPDTEFLHDYRVALRRSRSVLKQARGILPQEALDEWRPALRDLQVRTNAHRDLDVFLLEFDGYRAAVPQVGEGDLEPLRDLLLRHRRVEHAALVSYLDSEEHRSLLARYRAFLSSRAGQDRPVSDGSTPDETRPVDAVAAGRIRRAHRRLLRSGAAIGDASPAEPLHELRISGKELRYLLELYGSLYDRAVLGGVVRELKALQDNLGEFQDCEIHAQRLHEYASELRATADVPTSSLMAVALVAQVFIDRQAQARAAFAGRFTAFASRHNVRLLDRMLTKGGGPG